MSDGVVKKSFWRRPTTWLLAASLALNLFFGFKLVGHFVGPHLFGVNAHPHTIAAFRHYVRNAPEDIREAFWKKRRESREAGRADRDERSAARKAARETLRQAIEAEPFDAEAVKAAFSDLRQGYGRNRSWFIEFVGSLPLAERKKLGAELAKVKGRRWKRDRY